MSALSITPETLYQSDGFRRLLGWSAAAHVLLAMLVLSPLIRLSRPAPAPIFVDIVSLPAGEIARPRQIVDEPVVIPKRPRAKPVQEAKPAPVKAPVKAPVEKKPEQPALTPEQILEQLRAKHADPTRDTPASASSSVTGRLDPELASYRRKVENLIYANWAGARAFRFELGLEVVFEIEVDAGGQLKKVELVQGSGKRHLDESAERAIRKAAPYPPPPRSVRVITVHMNPRDQA